MATQYQRDLVMARLAYPEEVRTWLEARRKFTRVWRSPHAQPDDLTNAKLGVTIAQMKLRSAMREDDRFHTSSVHQRINAIFALIRTLRIKNRPRRRRKKKTPARERTAPGQVKTYSYNAMECIACVT